MKSHKAKVILFALIVSLSLQSMANASEWFEDYNPVLAQDLNKIIARGPGGEQLFAAGLGGTLVYSNDHGRSWLNIPNAFGESLYAIEVLYGVDTTIIVAGDGGLVANTTNFGQTWAQQNIGGNVWRVILHDGASWWLGGDGRNQIFRSLDGDSWAPVDIDAGVVDVLTIISTPFGVYATGNQPPNGVILRFNGTDTFNGIEITPDTRYTSSYMEMPFLYFGGFNTQLGQGVISKLDDIGGAWGTPVHINPAEITTDITDIKGHLGFADLLWVSTLSGQIMQSNSGAVSFTEIYQNPRGENINSMATVTSEFRAWGAGSFGLFMQFGFSIRFSDPPPNGSIMPAQNILRVGLTGQAEFSTILNGTRIFSSVRGNVPFSPTYQIDDSTIIELNMATGSLPSEKVTVILSEQLQETGFPAFLEGTAYDIHGGNMGSPGFALDLPFAPGSAGEQSTNYVTGFFNDDNIFDVITYVQDELHCFAGTGDGDFAAVQNIILGPLASLNTGLRDQLCKADINLDGRQDLVLYDDGIVWFLINNSTSSFDFTPSNNQGISNIQQIEAYPADFDSTLDFAILGDALDSYVNADEANLGINRMQDDAINWSFMRTGDIDRDGVFDFAGIASDNTIILRRILPDGGMDINYPIPGSFTDMVLSDMNNDGNLDVLGVEGDLIQFHTYASGWSFAPQASLVQANPQTIDAINVSDFNGDGLYDVLVATQSNEIKIFQNMDGINFFEQQPDQRTTDIDVDGLIHGDFNMDGQTDLFAYDKNSGDFQQIIKSIGPGWIPNLDSISVVNNDVYLDWEAFPDPGALDYYRVYRDVQPGMMNYLTDVPGNSYTDFGLTPGTVYYYSVEAYDTSGAPSPVSEEWPVEILQDLSGPISGVLADTLVPYRVTGPIEVPQDSTLIISAGVEMFFNPGADFNIIGNLFVNGTPDHFVGFRAVDTLSTWPGITVSGIASTDTVFFQFFDIEGADQAFSVENRPLKIRFGSIAKNNTGLNIRIVNPHLSAENVMIIDNDTGIRTSNMATVQLKNVTIAGNFNEGIVANDFTSFQIKNAIIWHNNDETIKGPDIVNGSPTAMQINYSTVDSTEGNITATELSRILPLFQPMNTDSMAFVPDTLSATIDAGDPADDFSAEPIPNGGRINQGIYGGSIFAMPTFQAKVQVDIDTLRFAARVGQTDTTQLQISNPGTRDLVISDIQLLLPQFAFDGAFDPVVPPGETLNVDVTFLPGDRITYRDEMRIINNDPHFPLPGFSVPMRANGLNTPPVFSTVAIMNAVQDVSYIDTVRATDFDPDALVFSSVSTPSWMNVSPDGSLSGTPRNSDVGSNIPVQIRVSDGMGGSVVFNTTITVLNTNDAPVITTVSLNDAVEDAPYADTLIAIDIDPADSLRYDGLFIPAWMTVGVVGDLAGLPTNDDVGADVPVIIKVSDGNGAFDTLFTTIEVINTNDAPEITAVPDTVAFSLIPFQYTVGGLDVDGDDITFADDTPLFDVDPALGLIDFTPAIIDTGTYTIEISLADGEVMVVDTFLLNINLTPLNEPTGLTVLAGDQQLNLSWTNPDNQFYSGTIVSISDTGPVDHPDSGIVVFDDTTLTTGSVVQATVSGLEIGRLYHISIFNYFDASVRLYSDPLQTTASTLLPLLSFDFSERDFWVPPERILFDSLRVKNEGGGTLLLRFSYVPNIVNRQWFAMDTTDQVIAPFDSVVVAFQMNPMADMPDLPYSVDITLQSNDMTDGPDEVTLNMRILFDTFKPELNVILQPDTLHKYSATRFQFSANDTVEIFGWDIGYPTDSLKARYQFIRLPQHEIVREETDIPLGSVDFYPLPDGQYRFDLWVYDPDRNGIAVLDVALRRRIHVQTSLVNLGLRQWYLASFPREQELPLGDFFRDSTSQVFRWSNASERYISFHDSTLSPGEGVWVLTREQRLLNISEYPITQNLDSIEVPIEMGWNQIGVPTGYPIAFADLQFLPAGAPEPLPIELAVEQEFLIPAVYWYKSNNLVQGYEWAGFNNAIGEPWHGYWIFSVSAGTLIIQRDPVFPDPADIATDATGADGGNQTGINKPGSLNWEIPISLHNSKFRDGGNIIGITDRPGGLPVYEPPHMSDFCSAYFNSRHGQITRDLREPFEDLSEVKKWQIHVSSSRHEKHFFSWPETVAGSGMYVYLVDNRDEKIIDMAEVREYEFGMNSNNRSFTIYATSDAGFVPKIIPEEYRLVQNYPNPFNPSTTIRFGVPSAGDGQRITLKIFNLLGQEVFTLLDKTMSSGYHQVVWNGVNTAGKKVASGVYFYSLKGAGSRQVRKMILLK